MAYAESTIGGSSGSSFRVWINSIRTFDGNQAQNYEQWRAEGGVNRVVSGTRVWNLNNNNTYNVQLGINGMAASGSFSYDAPANWTGGLKSWGTGTTTANRNSAGTGFGFQSRMDVNMNNSPYLTSGWVTSNDSVQTKARYGDITAITPSAAAGVNDETGTVTVDWYKHTGRATLWFRLDQINGSDTTHRKTNVTQDPYQWTGWQSWVQTTMVNTNSTTLYIYYGDDLDSNGSVDRYDTANTRTLTIKNNTGQANPTFLDYDYLDTNAASVAITGNDQALIQGKSTLEATVVAADKATPNKNAIMKTYSFTVGSYSSSSVWSNTLDVVKNIGVISDVTGTQDLSVRAIDSRGNSKTITKQVEILPYNNPGYYVGLDVSYVNDFDTSSGIEVSLLNNTTIGSISPLTLGGSDKNAVTPTTGLRFDMAFGNDPYTGTWTDIAYTQVAGTGLVNVTKATLESAILSKYNTLAALNPSVIPNTERWYILFELTDKFGPQYFTAITDVGRPFFRIGADGRLYYKEIEFFSTFSGESSFYYPSVLAKSSVGTWALETPPAARAGGFAMFRNTTAALNDECYIDVYVPAGTYSLTFYFDQATTGGQITLNLDNQITFATNYETVGAAGLNQGTTGSVNFLDGATYRMYFKVNGKAASPATYSCRLLGLKLNRL
jgi:hypothetical protein